MGERGKEQPEGADPEELPPHGTLQSVGEVKERKEQWGQAPAIGNSSQCLSAYGHRKN